FDAELVADKNRLISEIAFDVYREMVLPMTGRDADRVADLKLSELSKLVNGVLSKPAAELQPVMTAADSATSVLDDARDAAVRTATDEAADVEAWLDQSLGDGLIGDAAAIRLRAHLQSIVDGDFTTDDCRVFDAKERKQFLEPPSPLPAAADEFGRCCSVIIDRVINATGENLTLSTAWPDALSSDPDVTWALARICELRKSHADELDCLLNATTAASYFNQSTINKKFPPARMAKLAAALDAGPDHVKALVGTLSRMTIDDLKAGRITSRPWPTPAALTPFMDACANVVDAASSADARWVLRFKLQFIERCRQHLEQTKVTRNIVTYDDLLVKLRDALEDGCASAPLLKRAVAQRFRIAVIDEFQDTDPVQYQVFARAFHDQELPVFVVGDPKQAIYGFRSGDLQTYFNAREQADTDKVFSLLRNWRSDGNMVAAVNELFAEDPADDKNGGVHRAFATDRIWFSAAEAALAAGSDPSPLTVELISKEDGKTFTKDKGVNLAAELTARRIADLLRSHDAVQARDVAVLVQKHAEARVVKTELAELGIPAVLQSAGKVFDSDEATDFRWVVAAMVDPTDLAAVRAALATPLFPTTARELCMTSDGIAAKAIQEAAGVFGEAHDEWLRSSFLVGFNRVLHGLQLRLHLLRLDDGERRLTNVNQVAEILERVAREQKLGMHATKRWLDRQLDAGSRVDSDEYEIRLESDDDAVRIMTVFKSKGLQFPYVFAPFMWSKQPKVGNSNFLEYHDSARDAQLILDLDKDNILERNHAAAPVELHEDEKLAEQLRLLYVAVTRAKHRMHLVGGSIGTDQRHALHYLLTQTTRPTPGLPIVSNLPKKVSPVELKNNAGHMIIADTCGDMLLLARPPAVSGTAAATAIVPKRRQLSQDVDKSWQILSFSKLADHGYQPRSVSAEELRDYDDETLEEERADRRERDAWTRNPDSLFSFAAGKKTGNCWHAIFEHMDFTDTASHRDVVIEWGTRFRLLRDVDENDPRADGSNNRQIDTLCRMVSGVLNLDLPGCAVRLADVPLSNCLAEMQFDFPVPDRGVSRATIAEALLASDWDRKDTFADILNAWAAGRGDDELSGATLRGFMTGFIDLTFRDAVDGKYYLLDWKSNRLDGTYEGFTQSGISEEMGRNRYFFQYLLYSVALHHYLSGALPGYSYEKNFGGGFYVFLRGVLPQPGTDPADWDATARSVYADRPSLDVINRLSDVLGQFAAPEGGGNAID
ncbi:MAG: UvrD-helicase domain-containing protein, partial [Planctomycetota bacterium]